jgi:hypothetical protein
MVSVSSRMDIKDREWEVFGKGREGLGIGKCC